MFRQAEKSSRARRLLLPRREVIRGAMGAALAAPFVGIGAASANDRLTVMTVGGSWLEAIKNLIGKPFTDATGATVIYDQRPNAQQIAALEAARNRPTVDVIELGGPRIGQVDALDLVEEFTLANIPNYADVYPIHKKPKWVARLVSPFVLTFNESSISRTEVESKGWQILLDPKLKGKVAIPKFGWQGEMWLNAVNVALGGTYENFDPIVKFARSVVRDNGGKVMESNDQGMQMFTTGEVLAAPFWTGRTYELQDKGVKVDCTFPKGWIPYGVGLCVVKGTQRKPLAEKFIDIALSVSVQQANAERFSYPPTNKKASDALKDNKRLAIGDAAMNVAADLDYSVIYKYSDKNLERFNKEIVA